ncbi:MAG: hypothetical protein ACRD21_18110, partial [Vicinamibacteria bacterium]
PSHLPEFGGALVRRDLPPPEAEAAITAAARVRRRSRRRLRVEISVLLTATALVGLGWLSGLSVLDDLQIAVFAGWVAGTWTLRSALFARRPRINEPLWSVPSAIAGLGVGAGIGSLFIPNEGLATRLVYGAGAIGLVSASALLSLYLMLAAQARLQRWRFSADTSGHVLHWCLAAALYSLLWGVLGPRGGWLLGAVWVAGMYPLLRASRVPTISGRPLVFLRNFALGDRSASLLRAVAERWLELGPVDLITGPDVAGAKPDPTMVLALLTLRLRKRFVSRPSDAEAALASWNAGPPRDGRHRIRELACRDSAWEAVVSLLVNRPEVMVVMDLRGFDANNRGCARELEILRRGALAQGRVILLIDDRTDLYLLASIIARESDPPDAPLLVYDVRESEPETALRVVALAAAASRERTAVLI